MMKTKRWIGTLLCILLCACMLPVTAHATEYGFTVYDSGTATAIQVTSDNAADVLEDGGTVSYDETTNTLTLNNATLTSPYPDTAGAYVVSAINVSTSGQSLNIVLMGANTIAGGRCIYVNGALTISGSGSLTATGQDRSIYTNGNLTIDGATVTASTVTSAGSGIETQGTLTIQNGANVTGISSGAGGIYGDSGITIESSTVSGTSTSSYAYAGIASQGSISITSATVTAKSATDAGLAAYNGNLTIANSTVEATGEYGADGYGSCAICGNTITISGGSVTATETGKEANAIYSYGGSIEITNGATVTAKATNTESYPAVFGTGGVSISSSNVTAEAGGDAAIYSPEDITIDGSTISIASTVGAYAKGTLTLVGDIQILAESNRQVLRGASIATTQLGENAVIQGYARQGSNLYYLTDYTLTSDFQVATGRTLTIPEGVTLTLAENATLSSVDAGTITNNGTIAFACDTIGGVADGALSSTSLGTVQEIHSWDSDPTVDTPATCTTDGSQSIHCKNCDATKDVTAIPATGHSYIEEVIAPSYTEQGYTVYTCETCGESYQTDFTDILVLDGTDPSVTTQVTVGSLTSLDGELPNIYSSVDELIADLVSRVTVTAGYTEANTAVYDVYLQYSVDGGAWAAATADNFPTTGITVTLPYPDGTDASYSFTVLHMFTETSSRLGITAGETESPTVTKTDDGLVVTLTGLSPVAISWQAPSTTTTTSPQTGDSSQIALWIGLLAVSGVGIVGLTAYSIKRRRFS